MVGISSGEDELELHLQKMCVQNGRNCHVISSRMQILVLGAGFEKKQNIGKYSTYDN